MSHKIYKKNYVLIMEIPLRQNSYDAIGELTGTVDNLVGIVAGDECSISQLIDLGYKDDQQEGMPLIMMSDEAELRKVCKELGIDLWVHEICAYCSKVIRGSCGYGDKGFRCYECSLNKKNQDHV